LHSEREVLQTVDRLFRRESGKVVAALVKRFGTEHLELAEDILQDVLLKALSEWPSRGMPQRPIDWMITAARNLAVDHLRRKTFLLKHESEIAEHFDTLRMDSGFIAYSENEISDDLLRMMFACCHPDLPRESQIILILRLLMGIDVKSIAHAMAATESATLKRLARSKQAIREGKVALEVPVANEIQTRLGSLLNALYLIFAIGLRQQDDVRFGREICEDAVRLLRIIVESQLVDDPRSEALLALMLYRANEHWKLEGAKEEADALLLRSARGSSISQYHLEAAIAEQLSRGAERVNYAELLRLYDVLALMDPSESVMRAREVIRIKAEL
jgi:RNA polymerase sigma factor (sigma-70 family)